MADVRRIRPEVYAQRMNTPRNCATSEYITHQAPSHHASPVRANHDIMRTIAAAGKAHMRAQRTGASKKTRPSGTAMTRPRISAEEKPLSTNTQARSTTNHSPYSHRAVYPNTGTIAAAVKAAKTQARITLRGFVIGNAGSAI